MQISSKNHKTMFLGSVKTIKDNLSHIYNSNCIQVMYYWYVQHPQVGCGLEKKVRITGETGKFSLLLCCLCDTSLHMQTQKLISSRHNLKLVQTLWKFPEWPIQWWIGHCHSLYRGGPPNTSENLSHKKRSGMGKNNNGCHYIGIFSPLSKLAVFASNYV